MSYMYGPSAGAPSAIVTLAPPPPPAPTNPTPKQASSGPNGVERTRRTRRRYEEMSRDYKCNFPGCPRGYSTLNHLNTHVHNKVHGPKRRPAEFAELRARLRAQARQAQTEAANKSYVSSVTAIMAGGPTASAPMDGHRPRVPPVTVPGAPYNVPASVYRSHVDHYIYSAPASANLYSAQASAAYPPTTAIGPQSEFSYSLSGYQHHARGQPQGEQTAWNPTYTNSYSAPDAFGRPQYAMDPQYGHYSHPNYTYQQADSVQAEYPPATAWTPTMVSHPPAPALPQLPAPAAATATTSGGVSQLPATATATSPASFVSPASYGSPASYAGGPSQIPVANTTIYSDSYGSGPAQLASRAPSPPHASNWRDGPDNLQSSMSFSLTGEHYQSFATPPPSGTASGSASGSTSASPDGYAPGILTRTRGSDASSDTRPTTVQTPTDAYRLNNGSTPLESPISGPVCMPSSSSNAEYDFQRDMSRFFPGPSTSYDPNQ
ncbi:hypothetical protein CC85DRAFT_4420 [Cutaneotrichosporon oleaginosum]|uniref:C2H2-type domain-containing protein n=1 Tax=Cutaneotrichosporon oleaginosum TaxID=879819 RepID=A0A0J0XZR4_9TREE|nr:uncharacterized protein CC85DRAFT_4420 [Cutaneotrichosporon oleaginosum]KLT46511.1 hypothetical protein CC85DRAFT_4420 [Cutaneotrichosporon oleaginosum]TXT15122.1 hypothetical protein COLE_01315 [Cutaneotrichosporon oleaginosum]